MRPEDIVTKGALDAALARQLEALRELLEGGPREAMLSIEEVAHELQIGRKTVEAMIGREELVASQVGRQWRIRRQDLDAYLEENRNRKAG